MTLCNPMNACQAPPLSMGILQARILQWVTMPSSRDLPNPRIEPTSPALQADSLPSEPPGKPVGSPEPRPLLLWCIHIQQILLCILIYLQLSLRHFTWTCSAIIIIIMNYGLLFFWVGCHPIAQGYLEFHQVSLDPYVVGNKGYFHLCLYCH